jgi:hypothetical protein
MKSPKHRFDAFVANMLDSAVCSVSLLVIHLQGIGEGIIPAVLHAKSELLSPGAPIVPKAIIVKAVLANCTYCLPGMVWMFTIQSFTTRISPVWMPSAGLMNTAALMSSRPIM